MSFSVLQEFSISWHYIFKAVDPVSGSFSSERNHCRWIHHSTMWNTNINVQTSPRDCGISVSVWFILNSTCWTWVHTEIILLMVLDQGDCPDSTTISKVPGSVRAVIGEWIWSSQFTAWYSLSALWSFWGIRSMTWEMKVSLTNN